ncbi:hypothetical protein ACWGM1_17085 [Sphingomonas zeae]
MSTPTDPGILALAALRGVAYLAHTMEHFVGQPDGVEKMHAAMLGTIRPFDGDNGPHAVLISKVFEEFRTPKGS